MKRRAFSIILFVLLLATNSAWSIVPWSYDGTIATFSDPALNGLTPLFTVDGAQITGGWSDAMTGLNLQVVLTGQTYNNAFFTMDPLTLTGGLTGAGTIKFYGDGEIPAQISPLFQIDFDSALASTQGISGDDIINFHGISFSGRAVEGYTFLGNEVFSFSFANLKSLSVTHLAYSATAAFTSSAMAAPEPTTIALLGAGLLGLCARRKKIRK
jgi:hypothetical protein